MAQGLGEVDAGDGLEGQAQRLHVRLLGVGVPRARVQDVAAVQDEEEGVDRACLGPQLPGSFWALRGTTGCQECRSSSLGRQVGRTLTRGGPVILTSESLGACSPSLISLAASAPESVGRGAGGTQ